MLGRPSRASKRISAPSYRENSASSEKTEDEENQSKKTVAKRRKIVKGRPRPKPNESMPRPRPRPTVPAHEKQNDKSGSSDCKPTSCDLIESGLSPPRALGGLSLGVGESKAQGDGQIQDDSSSDSSDEFHMQPTTLDLNSEFFRTARPNLSCSNIERVNDFSSIENNILSGIKTLTDSESEVEYTEVHWPCISSLSDGLLPSASTVKHETTTQTQVEKRRKTRPTRRRKKVSPVKPDRPIKEETNALDVLQLLKLGEGSSSEIPILTKSLSSDSSDNLSDLEEVAVHDTEPDKPLHTIPKEGVQITLEIPELNQKRKKKDFDMEAYLLRRINNRKRAVRVLVHKVSILCWIAHGRHVNSILNSELLLGISLSLIPSQQCYPPKHAGLDYMEQILRWFHKTISHEFDEEESKSSNLLDSLQSQLNSKKASSKRNMVLLFICVLRSLGIKTRLVLSLQPISLKLSSQDLCTILPKKSAKETKGESKSKTNIHRDDGKKKGSDKSERKTDITSASKSKEGKCATVQESKYFEDNKPSIQVKHAKLDRKSKYFDATSENSKSVDHPTECKSKSSKIGKSGKTAVKTEAAQMPIMKSKYFSKSEFEAFEKNAGMSATVKMSEKDLLCQNPSDTDTPNTSKHMPRGPRPTNVNTNESARKTSRALPSRSAKIKNKPLPGPNTSTNASDSEPDTKRQKRKELPQKQQTRSSRPKPSTSRKKKTALKSNNRKIRKPNSKPKSSASGSDFEPDEESDQSEMLDSDSTVDSDFKPQPTKAPKKWSGEIDRRVLSTDDEDDSKATKKSTGKNKKPLNAIKKQKQGTDIWAEVFLEAEEKWFSIDVLNKKVHCHIDLHGKATQPVLYVVAFNSDLSLKDVTRRYVVNWLTIKQRVNEDWWEKALKPFLGRKTAQDREEDEELSNNMLNNPLPKVIGEYKNHPLYVIKRHLLKFEAIYPPDAPTLGFVRGEAVYPRECVHNLHSREVWVKEAKVVKLGEQPYKIVKARPKYDKLSGSMITDQPLEVFGSWQLQDYEPPVAENGKVPRNEYGNVELFKPCMLPKGCAHIPIPGLSRVARKLGIDCAPAMVGFDYHSGGSHPTYDGYVVCEEFKDILLDAWNQEVEESAKRAAEKQEKRVYDNWKRLIKGLLIRERLKERYSFGEASTSGAKQTKAPTKKTARGKRK